MTTDVQTPPEKRKVSDLLIGRPLETRTLAHQVVSKKVGLAVFASDAISSTAYATVEILVILGLFALNSQGIQGAILQMVNHGLSTGALFLLDGVIYERRHTREVAQPSPM